MIWPFQRLRYVSRRSAPDVISAIQDVIAGGEWTDKSGRPFVGYVDRNFFKMRPKFGASRNSFMPYASGEITETAEGSAVRVFFYPHPGGLAICAVVLLLWAFTRSVRGTLIMCVFVLAMLFFGFIREVGQLKNDILGLIPPDGDDPKPGWTLK